MLGTYALSAGYYDAYYLKAQKVRTLIKGDFDALWAQGFDALVAPTSPTVAFPFGARLADPVAMYLSDACTLPVNMAGLPGISIPCGLSEGLPVGLQLIGAAVVGGRRCSGWRAATRRSPPTPTGAALEPAELAARRPTRRRRRPPSGCPQHAVGVVPLMTDRLDRPTPQRRPPPLAERALAERVRAVPPSGIRRFFDILATMDDVISLGVGEPDFDTPRVIVEAGVESLREGRTHYTSNFGTLELRRALAGHLERRYGVAYDPATELLITVGASEAVDLALRATCDPGRRGHPPRAVVRRLRPGRSCSPGGVVRHVADPLRGRLRARSGGGRGGDHAADQGALPRLPVQPDRRGPAARRSRTSSRASPCATTSSSTATRSTTASPTATYRHRAMSALPGMRERTILMGGFSKAYAMTGWRVGYVAAPAAILEGIVKVHQYGIMSAPTTAQDAALVAIVEGEPTSSGCSPSTTVAGGCSSTASTRWVSTTFEPRGAFYAFPRITSTGLTADAFTERLLTEEHVAVVPGDAFGPSGAGHVRMCYATSYERLEEALGRIGRFAARVRAEAVKQPPPHRPEPDVRSPEVRARPRSGLVVQHYRTMIPRHTPSA